MLAFALGANRPLLAARQCAQLPAIATLEGRSGRSAWGRRLISHLYGSHYSSPPVTGISGRSAGLQRAQRRANGPLRRSRGRGRHGAAAAPRTATRCGAAGAVTLAELRTPVTVAVAGCRPVNQRRFCLGTSALGCVSFPGLVGDPGRRGSGRASLPTYPQAHLPSPTEDTYLPTYLPTDVHACPGDMQLPAWTRQGRRRHGVS
jgi:hypothetical protein